MSDQSDAAEPSGASGGSVQPLAWGVMPGENLPLWRCSSKRQAEAVVVWLREQRPNSTPQAVPLVDGRHSPTITDEEREAIRFSILSCEADMGTCIEEVNIRTASRHRETLRGLLERFK